MVCLSAPGRLSFYAAIRASTAFLSRKPIRSNLSIPIDLTRVHSTHIVN